MLTLMGILAGIGLPTMTTFLADSAVVTESKRLWSHLVQSRHDAMQTGLVHRVVLRADASGYDIFARVATQNSWIPIKSVTMDNAVIVSATSLFDDQVVFDSMEAPYEDSQVDLPGDSVDVPLVTTASITLAKQNRTRSLYIVPETRFKFYQNWA